MSELLEELVKGDLGEVAKWVAILLLGIIGLVIVGLALAFNPVLLYLIGGVLVAVAMKIVGIGDKYAVGGFFAVLVIGIGFVTGVL